MPSLKNLFFYSLLFSVTPSIAQTWEPVGGGIYGGDTTRPAVYSMCVYSNKLYVGGAFKYAGKLEANHIASWNGTKWDTLSCGTNELVESMCVFNNMLCIGGLFNRVGKRRANCIALWVDTTNTKPAWYAMGKGIVRKYDHYNPDGSEGLTDNVVHGLASYNGFLYVIGWFSYFGDSYCRDIAKWNGNKGWCLVGKPVQSESGLYAEYGLTNSEPRALIVYNRQLYIGGWGMSGPNQSNNGFLVYNDTTLARFNDGKIGNAPNSVSNMMVYDSCLYVVGGFSKNNILHSKVLKWNGKNWSAVGKWEGEGSINSIVAYKGKVFVGGIFDSVCGKPAHNIACWNGNSWEPVGAGLVYSNKKYRPGNVQTLCVYKDELYAAGDFKFSGRKPLFNIAKLNLNKK